VFGVGIVLLSASQLMAAVFAAVCLSLYLPMVALSLLMLLLTVDGRSTG